MGGHTLKLYLGSETVWLSQCVGVKWANDFGRIMSNPIHVVSFAIQHYYMLPSGVCTKKWNESLATNTTWLLIVSTSYIPYLDIHLIPLSWYPTRYIAHPSSTYDDMFVLYQSSKHPLLSVSMPHWHPLFSGPISIFLLREGLKTGCCPGIHWYYPSSLICLCCCCYHQYPSLSAVF